MCLSPLSRPSIVNDLSESLNGNDIYNKAIELTIKEEGKSMQKADELLIFTECKPRHYCTGPSLITRQCEASIVISMLHARKQKLAKFKRLPRATQLAKHDVQVGPG